MSNKIKTVVTKIIAQGDVGKAISILLSWTSEAGSKFKDDIILLSSQYAVYRKKRNLILGNDEKLDKDLNRITFSLLDYLNRIEIELTQDPAEQEVFLYESKVVPKKRRTFVDWAINESRVSFVILIFGSLGILASILAISNGIVEPHSVGTGSTSNYEYYPHLSTFAICCNIIVAIIALIMHHKSNKFLEGHFSLESDNDLKSYIERSKRAVIDFNFCWKITWLGWLLLYITYLLNDFEIYNQQIGPFSYQESVQILTNFFSNLSSLGLISCFAILFYKRKIDDRRHYNTPLTIVVLISIVLTSGLEIALFIREDSDVTMLIFELIVGILSAISIALLMGRLDSKFINASIGLIFLIYFYAGIQPLAGFFGENFFNEQYSSISSIVEAFALNYALFAKSLLFILVFWLLTEGRLQTYLIRLNSIIKNIE